MGQRHQLFVIARVRGRYRCVAAFHSQWLYGRSVVYAASRLIRAFINPFNSAAIATELSTLNESDFEDITDDDADENPTVLCPYLTGLFVSSCRVDMDHFQLLRLSLMPVNVLPSECDNDDGYSCFDLTIPGEPRYCFWWPGGKPLKAQGYLDPTDKVKPAVLELLDRYSLLDFATLAATWPEDFSRGREVEQAPEGKISPLPPPQPPSSLSGLSVVSALRTLLSADGHETDSDDAIGTLATLVVEQNHLTVLRTELLAVEKLNANGMFLLKQLLLAEKASFVDLKPWLLTGVVDSASLLGLSDALQHVESLDLSTCSFLTADTLESLVLQLPNLKNVVALACPQLGTLTKSLPLSTYLATAPLLAAVHHTRFSGSGPECARWAKADDPPAGLTAVLFTPPFRTFPALTSRSMVRYGVELVHFGAEGVVRGFTKFMERLYDPDAWFDPSGFFFEMRAYFHPVGALATAASSDNAPCYSYGTLPSLATSITFGKADELWTEGPLILSTAQSAMQGVPRHPGWALVLNTKGSMPVHRGNLPPTTDDSAPEYAFERWDHVPGQESVGLQPVESLSVREWVGRLPEGHGRVPESVMSECEGVLARLKVGLRSLPLTQPIES